MAPTPQMMNKMPPQAQYISPYNDYSNRGMMGSSPNNNGQQPQQQSHNNKSVREEHIRELNKYGRSAASDMTPDSPFRGKGMPNPDMELKGMLPPVNMCAPGQFPGASNLSSAYRNNYPNSGVGDSVISRDPFSSQNLRRDSHLPISWRDNAPCGSMAGDYTLFGKWAPTKATYDNYITASGSARLSLNTRVKNPAGFNPWAGIRSQPPMPISGTAILFNDCSLRQDLIYNSTGVYPTAGMC